MWLLATNIVMIGAHPLDALLGEDYSDNESADYDLYYDQRQNGTENFRVRIDGVVIALPSSVSSQAASVAGSVSTDYLLSLASQGVDDDHKEDEKEDNLLDFFKSGNEHGDNKNESDNPAEVQNGSDDNKENKDKTVRKDMKPAENSAEEKPVDENPKKEENLTELRSSGLSDGHKKNKSQGRRRNKYLNKFNFKLI